MRVGLGASMVLVGLLMTARTMRNGPRPEWIGWTGMALILAGCIVVAGES